LCRWVVRAQPERRATASKEGLAGEGEAEPSSSPLSGGGDAPAAPAGNLARTWPRHLRQSIVTRMGGNRSTGSVAPAIERVPQGTPEG